MSLHDQFQQESFEHRLKSLTEQPMMALSIQQPWSWLIVMGHKTVENRKWSTKHRGKLLIHAGLKFDEDGYDWVMQTFPLIRMPQPGAFQMGGIVGVADLAGCTGVCFNSDPFAFGPVCWNLKNAEQIPFMPLRGQQGLFKVNYEVK